MSTHIIAPNRIPHHSRAVRPAHRGIWVYFAVVSTVVCLAMLAAFRLLQVSGDTLQQLRDVVIIAAGVTASMMIVHFVRRAPRLPMATPGTAKNEDAEQAACRDLLEHNQRILAGLDGSTQQNAAALSHYMHEVNCGLLESLAAQDGESNQQRRMPGE